MASVQIPEHVKINEGGPERYDLECTVCGMGVSHGRSFGMVSGADLAASFIVLHRIHTKMGKPNGLTPSGRVRR